MSHEERIKRAQKAASKQLCQCDPCNACVEDIIEAYLGDTVLYRHDREAGGSHIHPTCFVQVYPEAKE